MNPASVILANENEYRHYTTAYDYLDCVNLVLHHYCNKYASFSAEDIIKLDVSNKAGEQAFLAKHAVVHGCSDCSMIKDELGIALPFEMKCFYEQIQECLLLMRYPIRILSPQGIVMMEKNIREAEREAGCTEPDGVSLLRFVEIPGFSACFAFRRFCSDGKWRVVHCGDETTDELQREDRLWRLKDCEDFQDWFRRLVATDAVPLVQDDPFMFSPILAERGQ